MISQAAKPGGKKLQLLHPPREQRLCEGSITRSKSSSAVAYGFSTPHLFKRIYWTSKLSLIRCHHHICLIHGNSKSLRYIRKLCRRLCPSLRFSSFPSVWPWMPLQSALRRAPCRIRKGRARPFGFPFTSIVPVHHALIGWLLGMTIEPSSEIMQIGLRWLAYIYRRSHDLFFCFWRSGAAFQRSIARLGRCSAFRRGQQWMRCDWSQLCVLEFWCVSGYSSSAVVTGIIR